MSDHLGRRQSAIDKIKATCRELIKAGIYPSLEAVNGKSGIYVRKEMLRQIKTQLVSEEGLKLPMTQAKPDNPIPVKQKKSRIPPAPGSIDEARFLLRKAERSIFGKRRTAVASTES